MKIAVLGAGVSGLSAARKLYDKGIDVTVYEAESVPGGLARTRITDGYVYDLFGGHLFATKHPEIADWLFSIFPKEKWNFSLRNAKIFYKGKIKSYPFENALFELPEEDAVNCAYDFITARQGEIPENYADWLIWYFGKSIAEAYMLPYNEKIWSFPLTEMECSWMSEKMPLPNGKEVIRSLLLKDTKEENFVHSSFYYPFYGGIQPMIDAIAKPLSIYLSTPIKSIEHVGSSWFVNGDKYDRVISTIPLKELPAVMKLPAQVVTAIDGLRCNSLNTFLVDCPATDIHWLYIPDKKWRAHRIGFQSACSPYASPNDGGAGAFEIIGDRIPVTDNLLSESTPPELELGHIFDNEFTKYAYVIYDKNYHTNTTFVKDYINQLDGFYTSGRWGNWNYNNMDKCMLESLRLIDSIID